MPGMTTSASKPLGEVEPGEEARSAARAITLKELPSGLAGMSGFQPDNFAFTAALALPMSI
jgi:hypothetical protein